jgi:uncharacterized protein YrrD
MRIDLSAKIRTTDGHEAGRLKRVLIDPQTEKITGFVLSTGGLAGRDVIVDEHDVADASAGGDVITLGLSKAQLDVQPDFAEADFGVPPTGWTAPIGYGLPASAYLWPVGAAPEMPAERSIPAIKKGDTVKDRDGDAVGAVEDIRFDERTGELTGFIVKAGAGLERLFRGGQIAEIARDDILRVVDGEVRLAIDREEILPREHETGTR